jgi:hypothetical protein
VINVEQTVSRPGRNMPYEEYRDKASEAREQAERSWRPSDREAWLRIADGWMKLAQERDEPVNGVIGALSRIYVANRASAHSADVEVRVTEQR